MEQRSFENIRKMFFLMLQIEDVSHQLIFLTSDALDLFPQGFDPLGRGPVALTPCKAVRHGLLRHVPVTHTVLLESGPGCFFS